LSEQEQIPEWLWDMPEWYVRAFYPQYAEQMYGPESPFEAAIGTYESLAYLSPFGLFPSYAAQLWEREQRIARYAGSEAYWQWRVEVARRPE